VRSVLLVWCCQPLAADSRACAIRVSLSATGKSQRCCARVQVLERLLSTCTALCACGMQPPPTADVCSFPDLLDSLVQALDVYGRTPLHHAAWAGSPESVRLLCTVLAVQQWSVDVPDDCDWTPLHLACAAGNTACIDRLVEAGAKADVLDVAGWSPVHYAAQVRLRTTFRAWLAIRPLARQC
jgi:ankyrin repeat protein